MHQSPPGPSRPAFDVESLEHRRLLSSAPPYAGGTHNDIVYGSDGTIHVAWYNQEAGSLQYASRSASGVWASAVTIDSISNLPANTSGVGEYVSLAVDAQNRPAVAYFDAYHGDLKYASRGTGSWVINSTNIENTSGLYPSLVFNGGGTPLVSYYYQSTRDLRLARWTGSTWHRQTLDAADDVGRSSSMHLVPGSPDRVAIAYEKTTGGDFKYVEATPAGTWSFAVVDDDPTMGGGFTSLDFDGNDNPAFSYYDAATSTLKYASRSGSTWTPIGISGRISHWSNLWFNPADGSGHMVYYDKAGNSTVHLTKTATGKWSGANADLRLGGGNYVSAAFKNDGTIAYTYGSPYSAAVPSLGVGVLAGNLVQQPALASTPTVVSASRIDVAWTYPSGGAQSGFKVGVSTDGGLTFPDERTIASATARSAQITGLNAGESYTFTVRAYNATGDSTFSNRATAATPVAPPAAPSGLVASAASDAQVDLTWDDVANETGYKIERSLTGTGNWSQMVQLGANVTSYANTALSANTTYHYRIRATNSGGDSGYASFPPVTTAVAAPTTFTAAAQSSSRINLAWSAVSGATGYVVQQLVAGAYVDLATLAAAATGHSVGGLASNTQHTFRLYATGASGNSAAVTAAAATSARVVADFTGTPQPVVNDAGGTAGGGFGTEIAAQGNLILSGNMWLNGGSGGDVVLVDAVGGGVVQRFANPGDMPDSTDGFGAAIALPGNRVAISAPDADPLEAPRVYVYDDYEDAVPDLILEYPETGDSYFGQNIAAIGDDLLVSIPAPYVGGQGQVRRYDLATGEVKATYVSTYGNDHLGAAMAADAASDTVLLSAKVPDGVRVIEFNATTGTALREFFAPGAYSVNVAYGQNGIFIADSDNNAVYQFDRADTSPAPLPVHTYSGAPDTRFGWDLAVSDDRLLVIARFEVNATYDPAGYYGATGAAYVYDVATHALVQHIVNPTPDWIASDGTMLGVGDSFGETVAVLGGGQFAIGDPTDDTQDLLDAGGVYTFAV